jgi:pimeloyl-ACP methyl ester carboxylesterase
MNYSELFELLKSNFDLNQSKTVLPGGKMAVEVCAFTSEHQTLKPINGSSIYDANINAILKDKQIEENTSFRYPVFVPQTMSNRNQPIILLHGLNERSWIKYLPWAYRLAEQTGRAVILFPIAYHINRSPEDWGNPRVMQQSLAERKSNYEDNALSSFANVALSDRLSNHPLRFFTSGVQSANDLATLITQLKTGIHPLFPQHCRPDFFVYSIGAFLSQILFLANPSGIVDNSKLFLFCGGAYFCEMNGISKMIMDKAANERITQYYLLELKEQMESNPDLQRYFSGNPIAKAFWTMISEENNPNFRKERFAELNGLISGISLQKDKVIPADAIKKVMNQIAPLDFDFDYSHEVPFPLGKATITNQVNQAFDEVFMKASDFFNNN